MIVATFIASSIILPVAINLVSSFVYDKAKEYHRKKEDLNVDLNIIAEKTDNKKSIMISYKGPASGMKEALNAAVKSLTESKDE